MVVVKIFIILLNCEIYHCRLEPRSRRKKRQALLALQGPQGLPGPQGPQELAQQAIRRRCVTVPLPLPPSPQPLQLPPPVLPLLPILPLIPPIIITTTTTAAPCTLIDTLPDCTFLAAIETIAPALFAQQCALPNIMIGCPVTCNLCP